MRISVAPKSRLKQVRTAAQPGGSSSGARLPGAWPSGGCARHSRHACMPLTAAAWLPPVRADHHMAQGRPHRGPAHRPGRMPQSGPYFFVGSSACEPAIWQWLPRGDHVSATELCGSAPTTQHQALPLAPPPPPPPPSRPKMCLAAAAASPARRRGRWWSCRWRASGWRECWSSAAAEPVAAAPCESPPQEQVPDAKVLYSSATGASDARNLAFMTRWVAGHRCIQCAGCT